MKLALLFGSYREPSTGRRLLPYLSRLAQVEGFDVEILDAKAIGLPIIDKNSRNLPMARHLQTCLKPRKNLRPRMPIL